jgi:hypothetical protein
MRGSTVFRSMSGLASSQYRAAPSRRTTASSAVALRAAATTIGSTGCDETSPDGVRHDPLELGLSSGIEIRAARRPGASGSTTSPEGSASPARPPELDGALPPESWIDRGAGEGVGCGTEDACGIVLIGKVSSNERESALPSVSLEELSTAGTHAVWAQPVSHAASPEQA